MSFINERFWQNGPCPGGFYNFPANNIIRVAPVKETLSPAVTGTSVIGITFDGGILIAADTLGSYGSLARFTNCSRLMKVNDSAVIGFGGDYADYQYIKLLVEQKVIDDACTDDGFTFTPKAIHCWLTRVLYNRRSRFDPLWNTIIVAGWQDGKPFLGYVDKIGVAYESPMIASGYGSYIALPLLRAASEQKGTLTENEAKDLMDRCLKVLYYRDARSLNKYELGIITKDGIRIESPKTCETDWNIAHMSSGYE